MYDTKLPFKKRRRHVTALIVVIIALLLAGLLLINRQYVVDQLSVWQYQPSSEIAAIAKRDTMSDAGRFIFYASHPALDEQQDFNKNCVRREQNTAILGCYDGARIYIYNIQNPALDGIREVTAAHEMLHAVYQRMGASERRTIDGLLEDEYVKLKDNKDFAARVAFYARTEPGERGNELHSVIGTEIASISPALEKHYATYFTNRSALVNLHVKYASVFDDLKTKADELSNRLTNLGSSIEQDSAAYNTDVAQLNDDIAGFNARAKDNNFSSLYEFNTARAALVARADALNAQRDHINGNVTEYNSLRDQLSQVVLRSDELNRSIDSSLAPAPSI